MVPSRPSRRSALAERHLALGADETGEWNGMAVPRHYAGDPLEEVLAVRTRVGLFDISAHRIIDVQGPDAASVLDWMVSGDVAAARPGIALAGAVLDDAGGLIDDLLILCRGPDTFRLSHGSGTTAEALAVAAEGARVEVVPNHDLHILSLQDPAGRRRHQRRVQPLPDAVDRPRGAGPGCLRTRYTTGRRGGIGPMARLRVTHALLRSAAATDPPTRHLMPTPPASPPASAPL